MDLGLNSCENHVSMRLIGKKRFNLLGRIKILEQWKKIMWSDESRFTLIQIDGCITVRGEADEVMHPSCLVPSAPVEVVL